MSQPSTWRARRFLAACRGEPVDTTPVWIMRQAGRYLPEYRALRAKSPDFLSFCKTPDLATQATLLPVDFLQVDAAIIFSDILVLLEAMGAKLSFVEGVGPRLEPVKTEAEAARLRLPVVEEDLGFVIEAIRQTTRALDGKVPLIGFAGAPWTLLAYLVDGQGGGGFTEARRLLFEAPALAHTLLGKITDAAIAFLRAQVAAGAGAVQLFDSWAGWLAPEEYRTFALHYAQRVVAGLSDLAIPVIYFAHPGGSLWQEASQIGAAVLGIDHHSEISSVRAGLGEKAVLQGNLDPTVLFAQPEEMRRRTAAIIAQAGPRHIFNLGHGILPQTPPAHAQALVEMVHELGRRP